MTAEYFIFGIKLLYIYVIFYCLVSVSEQSSSSTVVKNVISSRTVVTETTVSRTTGDGTVTETSSSVQHFNTGGVEIVEGTGPINSTV